MSQRPTVPAVPPAEPVDAPARARPAEPPLGLVVAGLGGFAATVTDLALAEPRVRVRAVGDPAAAAGGAGGARVEALRAAGVEVLTGYEETLRRPGVEAVWLPVPIALHRPFAEAAFAAGHAVLCEKPLAGSVADAEAMVAAAEASGRPAALGFHDLFDPDALAFKRAAHGPGGIGRLASVTVLASWPRDDAYFARNGWAGRIRHGGVEVRDGPANNALAHYLMLGLFFAGDDDLIAATPIEAEAVKLRAAAIENYDTVSARLTLGPGCVNPAGIPLFAHLTHAAAEAFEPQLLLRGDRASWLWKFDAAAPDLAPADRVVVSRGGDVVRGGILPRFVDLCRGVARPNFPHATFAAGLAHARAVELVQEAPPTVAVPRDRVEERPTPGPTPGGRQSVLPGLLDAMRDAARRDTLLDPRGWAPDA